MSNVRLRRLNADYARLMEYVRRHPRVRLIQSDGDPPERYQFEYRVNSLRMVNGELIPVGSHVVEVTLPRNYPRTPPQCRMLSPVFHPNIAPHAICVGDHWSAGESLQSIITRIGEMLAYQSYNVKSPLNGEAARWVEENKHRIPLDKVSMLVEDADQGTSQPGAVPAPTTGPNGEASAKEQYDRPTAPTHEVTHGSPPPPPQTSKPQSTGQTHCPSCGKAYRISAKLAGRKVRCTGCRHVFDFPAAEGPPSMSNN